MDRSLQSGLEKRTRVGAWQSRVYRLERGYLSAWSDVVSAAANEAPGRTDCLFQGRQVAILSDQGDRRFKLEFPWDGAKTLQLRSNDAVMKESWMGLLRATLEEAQSQIRSTGSVFAYGGTAKHEQDEAYEEAAYLKTNRFLAAYVVDEQSRASYVNDLLNEGFHHVGDRAGSGGDVLRACAGAGAAITELLALSEDFREEMQGVKELRRGLQEGEAQSCELDPSVAAPKIQRFCEEHMSLVGRTISSRLMLELSPFMDSSVAGTPAAPTKSTRAELVSTRRRLDEAYAATDQLVILGTRAWFMDIRDCFLDCAGLENASQTPPTPPPEVGTQTAAVDAPPAAPAAPPQPAAKVQATPPEATTRRPSLKALAQVSGAFSAAKAATKGGTSKMTSSLSVKARGLGKAPTPTGAGASAAPEKSDGSGRGGGKTGSITGVSISIPGLFKRASRTATEEQQPSGPGQPATQQPSSFAAVSPRGSSSGSSGKDGHASIGDHEVSPPGAAKVGVVMGGGGTKLSKLPENEERERSNLFGGSSRSPSTSPRTTSSSASVSRASTTRGRFSPPDEGSMGGAGISSSAESNSAAGSATASASSLPSTAAGSGGRKEKRAFAGGLWGGGSSGGDGPGAHSARTVGTDSKDRPVTTADEAVAIASTSHSTKRGTDGNEAQCVSAAPLSAPATKPKPSGGKRCFAGGGLSGPPPASSQQPTSIPSDTVGSDNPFTAGSGRSGSGGGGARIMGGRAGAMHGSAIAADQEALGLGESRNPPPPQDAEPSIPAWAAESVPEWATASAGGASSAASGMKGKRGGATSTGGGDGHEPSNGPGLAPPSRSEQGQQVAADSSPFMKVEPEAPAAKRPSQRRPGEPGSRRAFGGGERLF